MNELLKNYSKLDLKKLPDLVKKNGFTYRLLERCDGVLMYEQVSGGLVVGYEVFKNKIVKHRESMVQLQKRVGNGEGDISKRWEEYREVFPSDEEFGERAWTYGKLERAQEAYHSLMKEYIDESEASRSESSGDCEVAA